jgi:hypothetical protein
MGKMMTTALAGAFLGLTVGAAPAAVPFANYNLIGNFVIEAHGFGSDTASPPDTGENAILGVVTFDGNGGVVPGGGLSFSHADNFAPIPLQINCSYTVTGGSYSVNSVTGAGTVTMTLGIGAFPGGASACTAINTPASFTFAFVLNNSGVFASPFATSASLQLIGFNPVPFGLDQNNFKVFINQMVMTGSLRLQGSASN